MSLAEQTKQILEILSNGFPAHRLELIYKYKDVILEWLNSKEFKEKYKNHPYPPLFNPSTMVWESTEPIVAWDFNIPLPQRYNLLVNITAGAGGAAFDKFLNICGVKTYSKWYGHTLAYVENYKNMMESQNCAVIITDFKRPETEKFWSLLDKKLPLISLVADPIKVVKTLVNHIRPVDQNPLVSKFNLTCPFSELIPKTMYHCSSNTPSLENTIKDCISENGLYRTLYTFDQKLKFLNPPSVHYVDASEISYDRAFDTMKNLAKKFGFSPPDINNKEVFTKKVNKLDGVLHHLPCTLYAHLDDITKTTKDISTLQNISAGGGGQILSLLCFQILWIKAMLILQTRLCQMESFIKILCFMLNQKRKQNLLTSTQS